MDGIIRMMQNGRINRTQNDEALAEFLERVERDFNNYLDSNPDLCDLQYMFAQNYDDPHVEQLYLLRYVYAYALEDTLMYKWVLEDRTNADNLSVESIGCGSFVDAWALKHAVESLNYSSEGIMHTGVDLVDWHYKFNSLDSQFIQADAGTYFDQKESLDSDVYIFPRSIGDFPQNVFLKIKNAFASKPITKPVLYLLISQRRVYEENEKTMIVRQPDAGRTGMLFETLYKRNFDLFRLACEKDYKRERLRDYDLLFEYPYDTYKMLEDLHDQCRNLGNIELCQICPMDRNPMLAMKHFSYNVFKFERTSE